jgi:integrase
MAVPSTLRSIIGKREFWVSINASSDAAAVRKLPAAVAQFQAAIDAARAEAKAGRLQAASPRRGRSLTPRQLADAHYRAQMQFDNELRNADHRFARGFVDDAYVAALRGVISGATDDQGLLETLGRVAHHYRSMGNFTAEIGTPEWRESVRALAVAELESLARTAERDEGDFTGQPSNPLLIAKPETVAASDPLTLRILGPDSKKALSEIVPDFVKERGAGPQLNHQCKITARIFEEFLEEAKPLYRITRADVRGFKQALSETPAHFTKRFPGLTLPATIKANKLRAIQYAPIDTRTVNEGYLSRIHSIFNWCVRNDVIPDNPATGVKVETAKGKGKGKAPRINFSPSDLTKIFSPALFDTSKPFDEPQWAALTALFTGARASELAQIKLDSIRHERGSLVVAIEEETKNAESQRLIPIHSALITLGFEKHVERLRSSGATHLFPVWYRKGMEARKRAHDGGKLTLHHHFPRFIPRAFNVTIKKKIGIHDTRKTFHSFRHTFATGLDRAGVPRSMQDRLCGHADHSPHAGYVHGEPVEAMKDAIEKLRFDGFVLGIGVAG